MADERNRWLDQAAAERVLRGGQAVPGGDRSAREAEARLRAALDMLAGPQPCAGVELPGEAAAVAAFRAARAGAGAQAASGASMASGAPALSAMSAPAGGDTSPSWNSAGSSPRSPRVHGPAQPPGAVRARRRAGGRRRRRPGGRRGGRPAGPEHARLGGSHTGGVPQRRREPDAARRHRGPDSGPAAAAHPFRGADGVQPTPGGGSTPGGLDSGALQGFGTGTGTGPDAASGGGADKDGEGTKGGKDALAGGTTSLKDGQTRIKAVDLCEAYRSGEMTSDRRERLSKLAKGLARIPHFCEDLLDGPARSTTPTVPRGSDTGGDVLEAPTLTPASPDVSAPVRLPSR